jgi:hypothetical protein
MHWLTWLRKKGKCSNEHLNIQSELTARGVIASDQESLCLKTWDRCRMEFELDRKRLTGPHDDPDFAMLRSGLSDFQAPASSR